MNWGDSSPRCVDMACAGAADVGRDTLLSARSSTCEDPTFPRSMRSSLGLARIVVQALTWPGSNVRFFRSC